PGVPVTPPTTRPPGRLVDAHCHLQSDRFARDADLVVAAARRAGVERILVPGWDRASAEAALELVERHPWLDASAGVHPHDAARVGTADWSALRRMARDPRVVAIGETGLDFDRRFSPVPDQLDNLRRNLRLALETGKPVILHCRSSPGASDAHDALVGELVAAGFAASAAAAVFGERPAGVVHSFSGPPEFAARALELGLAVSFSGLVFRRGEEASVAAARLVPADRLLVETDSPFLAPPGAPRRRNEPEWVRVTAAWLAEVRGDDPDPLGAALVETYDRVFVRTGRPLPPPPNEGVA
ncbi:MAG TPA: TatD family hydrolase, partial [Candidatus Limnocylindrales bacterium]|nr:TatD family hydrolase [Candidatus Limnocylindrales bacterium]